MRKEGGNTEYLSPQLGITSCSLQTDFVFEEPRPFWYNGHVGG